MGIYYYAVDRSRKKYFSAPQDFGIKSPSIYHPDNPFPHMVVMMNVRGCHFDILDDCSHDIPPDEDYEDVTESVYVEYLDQFKEWFESKNVKYPVDESIQKNRKWISRKEAEEMFPRDYAISEKDFVAVDANVYCSSENKELVDESIKQSKEREEFNWKPCC